MNTARTELPDVPVADSTLQEIDDLLEDVSRLADEISAPQTFHAELLERTVRVLGAAAGAVWEPTAGAAWTIAAQVDQSRQRVMEVLAQHPPHDRLLGSTADSAQGCSVLPYAAAAAVESPNPTDFPLLLAPVVVESRGTETAGAQRTVAGILEIVQRPGGSPAQHQGALRLLGALADLAAQFHDRQQRRVLEDIARNAHLYADFSQQVHAGLDLSVTAAAIATEGRRLLECDRLSVAVQRGKRMRIQAVGGVESFDRRANLILHLEELAWAVSLTGTAFYDSGDGAPLPPQISSKLQAWRQESQARSIAVLPLTGRPRSPDDRTEPESMGALIVERFAGGLFNAADRRQMDMVRRHAELALGNALEYESLPLAPLLRRVQRAGWYLAVRRLPRTVAVLGLLVALVASLIVIPADFEVAGRGQLQPELRRNVFARSDGIVTEVRTDHAQDCQEGDVLAIMSRSQLNFEMTRVLGEIATLRQRLASVRATRLKLNPQTPADREKVQQLAAEETEFQEALNSYEQQRTILEEQQEDLVVRSPCQGTVVTWNVRQLLEGRPVQKGQILMQVADLGGPWILEVDVPDDRMGHILEVRGPPGTPTPVSFMLATDAGVTYHGTIETIALATDVRPPDRAHVPIRVQIDREAVHGLRPNATAAVRIYCGRRSIGYVWFHGIWETLQKKVLF